MTSATRARRSVAITDVSLRLDSRRMTQGSSVNSVAAMMGSAASLRRLMATSPCNGTPPLMIERSL